MLGGSSSPDATRVTHRTGRNSVADSEKPDATKEGKAVIPCCTGCTGCTGTGYSYRQQKIANVDGLLVYCSTSGDQLKMPPHVVAAPPRSRHLAPSRGLPTASLPLPPFLRFSLLHDPFREERFPPR
jgi:hypothetical protein